MVGQPALSGQIPLVPRPGGVSHGQAQSLPLLVVLHRYGAPPVVSQAWVGPLGRRRRRTVAVAGHRASVYPGVQCLRRQEMEGHLQLAGVDVLALARPSPVVQGGHDRSRQEMGADGVGVGQPGPVGRQVLPPCDLVETGNASSVVPETAQGSQGPGLAHEAGAEHDNRRVD